MAQKHKNIFNGKTSSTAHVSYDGIQSAWTHQQQSVISDINATLCCVCLAEVSRQFFMKSGPTFVDL